MTIEQYIDKLNSRFKTGISTEHSYRGDLQNLLESLAPDVTITNEPSRVACGAPDYIITKGKSNIPVGYIEAKDIGKPLNSKEFKEQIDRYRKSLSNLIFTDYLEFQLFIDGEYKATIVIGEIQGNKIVPKPENYEIFLLFIKNFCTYAGQTIKSAPKLAKMMAAKARMMANVIEKVLDSDEETRENSTLKDQMLAFKQVLIHDIDNKTFADIYAQTIAYGMFAARYHDPTLENFSREEAATLIPKCNPFLRKLFQYVAGFDLDQRIAWIIDALVDVFLATDVAEILSNFGKNTQQNDPIIHFYETFLAEYDPSLRKSRGVWYTPEPVVNFIVRAVDDILKTEFGLKDGLADSSKIKIKVPVQGDSKLVEQEVHRVQILDPATGTGTFLAEVIRKIYKNFEGQQGIWSNYVEDHLIPRLNGFELLMASYAMAHLKLDMLLTETGYKPKKEQRLRVYLTNSLEEYHPDTGTLFANWLSQEANEANHIKRDTPVMVVMGNPPYSVSSSNKSKWIEALTADYKKDLNERNIQPLSDDYIKFIRFGHHFIDKNGSGVLAYISNNSFIDGIIHRQMRKHLLESFDKIYILDLHGNSKKKEICPDGSQDQNAFDIMQGVSINLFIKTGKKKENELGQVFHFDLQGKRDLKYEFLNKNSLKGIFWNNLDKIDPDFFFVKKDFVTNNEYGTFIKITDLFINYSAGIQSKRDGLFIDNNINQIESRISKLINESLDSSFIREFNVIDSSSYKLSYKIKQVRYDSRFIKRIHYRPFDDKYIYYDPDLIGRSFFPVMRNLLHSDNLGLVISKQFIDNFKYVLVSNKICDMNLISNAGSFGAGFSFPLYKYHQTNGQQSINQLTERTPNLNFELVKQIAEKLRLTYTNEKSLDFAQDSPLSAFAPIDILDYIYAVLHSPAYREKYKEFLKIDFPRIPYPKDPETFWQLVKLGGELRQIHLLESPTVEKYITKYPIDGNNQIDKIKYESEKVWINETQYFEQVPSIAWNFYIGGYQPSQKWLKDRKGRVLNYEDIFHYQKIIVALTETDRIMKEIDKIGVE